MNGVDFDEIILGEYKNSFLENLITLSLKSYKKIFLLVYDFYDIRFKKIYSDNLDVMWYYSKFLELFSKEKDIIIKSINNASFNQLPKRLHTQEQLDHHLNEQIDAIINTKAILVNSKKEFNKKVNADKQLKKGKKLYIGFNKKEIFDLIKTLIFTEADYFINEAEHKKFILDPFKKNYNDFSGMYIKYKEIKKNPSKTSKKKEIITSIRLLKPKFRNETASGGFTYYQLFRRFISANKNLAQSVQKINENIIKHLRALD